MKFLNVKLFAELKNCTRQTIYNAERDGEIDIDRSQGFPVVFLTKKNSNWKAGQNVGRPSKEIADIPGFEAKKSTKPNR